MRIRRNTTALATLTTVALFAFSGQAAADNYGGNSRSEQQRMVQIIQQRFGHGWLGQTMVCIARAESGLNPRARNWGDANGGSHGLFQINGAHRAWVNFNRITDPRYNTLVAWRLYRSGGIAHWTTRWRCT